LAGDQRPQTQFASLRFKSRWSKGLLSFQHELLLFLQQLFTFTTQTLALVAILQGCEMLLRREDKTASQNHSTTEQHCEALDGARVTLVSDLGISLLRGNSFHGKLPELSISDCGFRNSDSISL
jgi:hypothetical protein